MSALAFNQAANRGQGAGEDRGPGRAVICHHNDYKPGPDYRVARPQSVPTADGRSGLYYRGWSTPPSTHRLVFIGEQLHRDHRHYYYYERPLESSLLYAAVAIMT